MKYNRRTGTFTGYALTYAERGFLTPSRGQRANVPATVVVLTDGKAQDNPIRGAAVRR